MATILKTIYLLLPVGLFVFATSHPEQFSKTFSWLDSWQGPNGIWVLQVPGEPTQGEKFVKWADEWLPDRSDEVNMRVLGVAHDVDRIAYFLERYWVWLGLGVLFVLGLLVIMRARSYAVK
ncbi:MAG: hypothetical protein SNJ84_05730 [Verrucomicrobiia bacterium]